VRRDLGATPLWLRLPAWWLARREARALRHIHGMADVPQLLAWDGRHLDRSFMAGDAMYQRPPRGDLAWFRSARRLLQQLHRNGVAHNDLAKEANWLVTEDGRPALIDFQLAVIGDPRSRWMRLLAREDLRHLLKHKRMYCRESLTPVEKRVLKRTSWVRELWFATGKPVYRFVTRRILHWEDNEGQGRSREGIAGGDRPAERGQRAAPTAGRRRLRACLPGHTRRDGRTALQAYRDMAATIPGWFDGLMALRNRGMRLLGMKDLGSLRAVQDIAQPRPGQRLGIFTLQSLDDDAIVLEDDDRHLRVQLALQWQGDVLEVATVVHTHNAFGRLYMLPVAPCIG
jgi:hypothetical protein